MNKIEIIYDFSKYMDYIFQSSPTGISRIDVEYADFLSRESSVGLTGFHKHFHIPTRFSRSWLVGAVARIRAEWDRGSSDALMADVLEWLNCSAPATHHIRPATKPRVEVFGKALRFALSWPCHTQWRRPAEASLYLNTSYAGLESANHLRWLQARPDIAAVFLIHDLLPLDRPELFWAGASTSFQKKLEHILKVARLIIVPSEAVRARLRDYLQKHGRADLAVEVAHFPPAREFLAPRLPPSQLCREPYFLVCGTIEPRKNHALLLKVWQDFVAEGIKPPRLLVVGARGWKSEGVLSLMASKAFQGSVLEISGLSTDDLLTLMRGAHGLLMPSLDEGYGMPVVEALAQGVPVIASDIPVFREVTKGCATLLDLHDPSAWKNEIRGWMEDPAIHGAARLRAEGFPQVPWSAYFANVFRLAADHVGRGVTCDG